MNYKRLETFLWVATLGSFRRAAERQFTTQPAISSRIAALEEELGVKLFERGSGSISLTAKGQELLPYAEKIIFMSEQMRKRADEATSLSGLLRLGVSETIVHSWLPKFLNSLHTQLPNLDIELTVDVTVNLRKELLARSIDLGLFMGPMSEPSIANKELGEFPLVWVASSTLKIPERVISLQELTQWPIITYARNTRPYAEINTMLQSVEGPPARFFSSSSLAACLRLTLDGIGICSIPRTIVSDHLSSGELTEVKTGWTPKNLKFTASYSTAPYNPLAERAAQLAVDASQSE